MNNLTRHTKKYCSEYFILLRNGKGCGAGALWCASQNSLVLPIYPADDVRKSSSFDTNFSWCMYEMFHPSNFGRPCLCCYAHAPHFVSSAPKKLILSRKACSSQTTISISALASFLLSPACCRAEAGRGTQTCMYVRGEYCVLLLY
jgi:hypothetical protein